MDVFTNAFLSRGKDDLRNAEAEISYVPFGIDPQEPEKNGNHVLQHENSNNEPESVRRWRTEYNANIEKKDANEAAKNEAMKENAKKELVEWQTWYKKNLAKAQKQNLAHEEELQARRTKSILLSQSVSKVDPSDSAVWERVCQLCDLTITVSSGDSIFKSATGASTAKDVTRFRSLLLSLKNNPPSSCH